VAALGDRGPPGPAHPPGSGPCRRHRQQGRLGRPARSGLRRRRRGARTVVDVVPRGRPAGARERRGPRVGLDPPRRREPRPRRTGRAAGGGRGRPRGRRARAQAARVALAATAARGGRDDLRHRSSRDRPGAQRVRPGPARRRPHRAGRQHGRHARAPLGARGARRLRRAAGRVRQRHRLRLARRGCGPQDGGRAGGRGLPRGGRPPRSAADTAHRSAHALPGASGSHVHAARQRPGLGAAVEGRQVAVRDAPARPRFPARAFGGPGLRRAGGPGVAVRQPRSDPRRPARAEEPAAGPRARRPGAAGALVAALPARARRGQRPRDRADPPGPGRRRAPAGCGRGSRGGPSGHASADDDRRRGRGPGGRHGAGGPVPDQPGCPRAGGFRAAGAVRSTRGHRSCQRRRSLGRPGRRRLPVAAADRLVARPGPGRGRARAAVRAAARDAGHPARRQRLRGRVGGPAAGRPGRPLGRVAVPAGRRPPQRRRRRTPLAAGRGLLHVRVGPRHQRRVGRRPAGDRRRDRRAAVAGARGPGLRRPRARSPVAGGVALRSAGSSPRH
jgi:hypothetical protein